MGNKLIGHGETLIALINLYILKKLPNSIILSGPKGIGKSVLAKHFLNYILTQNEINKYDLKNFNINLNSKSFLLIENNTHPNVFIIEKKKDKKNIDINQIREMIKFQNNSSFNNSNRVVLIKDVDELNINSINALLKSIEEPNDKLLYILLHNTNNKLTETLKSRCIEFKINIQKEYIRIIVDNFFNKKIYESISSDFKNYYDNPSFLISLVCFCDQKNFDVTCLSVEDLLAKLSNNSVYLKDDFIIQYLNLLIELYFYKNITRHRKNLFKAKEYFQKKLYHVRKYNLDIETFFLEFNDLFKNG